MAINLRGAFFLSQHVARQCIAAGRPGAIVNIASVHVDTPVQAVPVLADFRVVRLIGEGNHGRFYLAHPPGPARYR